MLNDFNPVQDTSSEAQKILDSGYRRMSPEEKLIRVRALTLAVQQLALADIKTRHPHAGARELQLRLASRWLDPELMRNAFEWDPDVQGF